MLLCESCQVSASQGQFPFSARFLGRFVFELSLVLVLVFHSVLVLSVQLFLEKALSTVVSEIGFRLFSLREVFCSWS